MMKLLSTTTTSMILLSFFSAVMLGRADAASLGEVRQLQDNKTIVPIHIHVIKPNETYGDLLDTDRDDMIAFWNEKYSITPYQFEVASQETLVNETWFYCGIIQEALDLFESMGVQLDSQWTDKPYFDEMKRALYKGDLSELNLYLCRPPEVNGKLANDGAATFPTQAITDMRLDGMYLYNPSIISDIRYSDDNNNVAVAVPSMVHTVGVHEMGHWFGLYHPFENARLEDGCKTEPVLDADLAEAKPGGWHELWWGTGDMVEDTPAMTGQTGSRGNAKDFYGDNVTAFAEAQAACWDVDPPFDTCPDLPGVDPVKNIMNYIGPNCYMEYGLFTPGQLERMVAVFETFRAPGMPDWDALLYNETNPKPEATTDGSADGADTTAANGGDGSSADAGTDDSSSSVLSVVVAVVITGAAVFMAL